MDDPRARLSTESAERHALERLTEGLDLAQVVVELAVLRDCILAVWDSERSPGEARPEVRFLNRSVDRAITASVERYTLARDRTVNALDRISTAALESRDLDDLLERLLRVLVDTTPSVETGVILLTVSDTGPGIPEDVQRHLFEPYWRGREAGYRGSGLGLAITCGIVEAHGGRIWAESRTGAGASFFFTVPVGAPVGRREP